MTLSVVPSDPRDREKLKQAIGEITNCMLRIDGEREQIKAIISDNAEEYGIEKKLLRKIATTMYKHNYDDVQAEQSDFELLFEALFEKKAKEAA